MKFDPNKHHRKSIRLKDYDYTSEGLYFITICVQNRLCILWEIISWKLQLFESWLIVQDEWNKLEKRFENIKLHNFIVMPNHFHGIIEIVDKNIDTRIWDIVGWFKSITTNKYIKMVNVWKAKAFPKRLWQRNYYEHIIRNQESYNNIDQYISMNVEKWSEDTFHNEL